MKPSINIDGCVQKKSLAGTSGLLYAAMWLQPCHRGL
jgi:hypothetical protein